MKPLPVVDISYRPLHEIAMGPLKAALLNLAIDLNIFDKLTQPVVSEDVAANLNTDIGNTERFLNALATLDLLEKKNGHYQNRPLADTFLVSTASSYIAPLLKQIGDERLNPLAQLSQLVKNGPLEIEDQPDFSDPSIWAKEAQIAAGWALGGVGQLVADVLSGLPGFSRFEKMLDLGCGHGMFSLYALDRHPSLISVLLDRPEVLQTAKMYCDAYEASERIKFLPADYMTDSICDDPDNGYDLVYAGATLNFAIHRLDDLISKIHDALKPGGYFVSFQDGMTHECTRPDTMMGAVIPAMVSGADYFFPQGMIAERAVLCGFQSVRSKTVSTPAGEMDIDIAQKAKE